MAVDIAIKFYLTESTRYILNFFKLLSQIPKFYIRYIESIDISV